MSRHSADSRTCWTRSLEPEPEAPGGIRLDAYDGEPGRDVLERLNRLIERGPFEVHLAGIFPLEELAKAQEVVARHHLGKVVVRVGG